MKKGLIYLVGIGCLGAGFCGGFGLGKYNAIIREYKEAIHIRQKVEPEKKPEIPEGFELEGYRIDLEKNEGIYKGSDGYFYRFHYDLENNVVSTKEVDEELIR